MERLIESVVFQDTTEPTAGTQEAIATLSDGEERFLFAWFADDVTIVEEELINLTVEEARQLKQLKDTAYLRAA